MKRASTKRKFSVSRGFTFVELVVGIAVFLVVVVGVYSSYTAVFTVVQTSRAKIDAISLIDEQLEIIRNLPYSSVGIVGGIPSGVLSHTQTLVRDTTSFLVTLTVRNIDDPFDGTVNGTPKDTSPADYKLVEVDVDCPTCKNFRTMTVTTQVAPKNLETASTNGALLVKVIDANGNPLADASVHIQNNQVNPTIAIDDVTNNQGVLEVVDVPPGTNAYAITVTKAGYSTDQTYASSVSNPNPSKPLATVLLQQLTQITFIIDKLSTFAVSSVNNTCTPIGNIDFSLTGNKLIGTNPNVFKYNQNQVTNSGGTLNLSNIEWDTYTFLNIDPGYDLVGMNPLSPVAIVPNSTQNIQLVLAPKNSDTLWVTVRDGASGLPLSGVSAELTASGYDMTAITGQGFLGQIDWSGGSGQATSSVANKYLSSDGNIETQNPTGQISLKKIFGSYVSSGVLTSSSYDTGGGINFQQILWDPIGQPLAAGNPTVRVQIATNNDGGTWNFLGPDGTSATYYTTGNQNINAINNGNRYLRYKIFLDTASTSSAPTISDVSFTYTSSCTPPGQVFWNGLSAGNYVLHLSKAGYASQDIPITISSAWQSQNISLVAN